jgi:outer membrane murein-binding lipoprotein Lpp
MTSRAGKRTAGAVGGVSLGALVALAGPEYFKLREAAADVAVLHARVQKLEDGNKAKWEHISVLEEKQSRNIERITRLEVLVERSR